MVKGDERSSRVPVLDGEKAAPPASSKSGIRNLDPKWWVLLAVGISTFMSALDTSVVNTVLPVIRASFQSGVEQVEWVVTIYLLVLSGLLLTFGRLGDLRGHKLVFLSGFLVFVFSSAMCGLANSVHWLVAFRGLQAIGASMISANSPAILTKNFPDEQRGQALGLQATMTYLGLTVGPSLGGILTQLIGWRSVFYINVPIGALALWIGWHFIPTDGVRKPEERFDPLGAGTFMVGLSALLLGLNQGSTWGWSSLPTLFSLAAAGLILLVFIWHESRSGAPMLDLTLFRSWNFSLASLSAVFNYICVYSVIFLLPFFLIQGKGLNPAQAGLLLTAQPIVMAVVAPISGTLSDRIGTRLPSVLGMFVLSLGIYLLSRLSGSSSSTQVVLALLVVGFGTGTFISPNNSALMGSAPRSRQGIAAGVLATARNFGMVLGVGISGAIFTTVMAHAQAPGSSEALFAAVQASFIVAAGLGLLGVVTSFGRSPNVQSG